MNLSQIMEFVSLYRYQQQLLLTTKIMNILYSVKVE